MSQEVVSIGVNGLERFNEEREEILPFLEADFVVVISVGSLENEFDFSEAQVVVLVSIEEFVEHVVVIVSHIGEFLGKGVNGSIFLGSEVGSSSESRGEFS